MYESLRSSTLRTEGRGRNNKWKHCAFPYGIAQKRVLRLSPEGFLDDDLKTLWGNIIWEGTPTFEKSIYRGVNKKERSSAVRQTGPRQPRNNHRHHSDSPLMTSQSSPTTDDTDHGTVIDSTKDTTMDHRLPPPLFGCAGGNPSENPLSHHRVLPVRVFVLCRRAARCRRCRYLSRLAVMTISEIDGGTIFLDTIPHV